MQTMAMKGTEMQGVFAGKQWQQVLERDQGADGMFVYAVKSTKVYCRPSCPSRRPQRKNVTFFPGPEAARMAGYRACLRCKPDQAEPRSDPQMGAVGAAAKYLSDRAGERTRLEDVARATGVGRLTILRGFKRVLGVTPSEFAKAQRIERFKERVTGKDAAEGSTQSRKQVSTNATKPVRITDALYEAGFGSSSRLYEGSADTLGMKPKEMREGGAGLLIRYATAGSPLGRMLVAVTDVGVCMIAFGRDDAELEGNLRERYSKAKLVVAKANKGWLKDAVEFVASQMTEHPAAASFPLHVRATAFQQRVWAALREIPRGETRSYGDLAFSLGLPHGSRAVAGACGANPVAVAVPCHRVVGRSGSLTGYRWGLARKEKLLKAEGALGG